MTADKPVVTATPHSYDTDAVITFTGDPGQSAWIEVDPGDGEPLLAVRVVRTGEGIAVDLYPIGAEDREPVASAWALFTDG